MKERKMKVDSTKHQKKAKVIKGLKMAGGAAITIGTIGITVAKKIVKNSL